MQLPLLLVLLLLLLPRRVIPLRLDVSLKPAQCSAGELVHLVDHIRPIMKATRDKKDGPLSRLGGPSRSLIVAGGMKIALLGKELYVVCAVTPLVLGAAAGPDTPGVIADARATVSISNRGTTEHS